MGVDDWVTVRDPRPPECSAAFVAAERRLPLKTVGGAVDWYCNDGFEAFVPDLLRTADGKSTLGQHDR